MIYIIKSNYDIILTDKMVGENYGTKHYIDNSEYHF